MTTTENDVLVYWYAGPATNDWLNTTDPIALSRQFSQERGRLTVDHPSSCNGIPVLVCDDGRALGPAEVPVISTETGIAHWAAQETADLWSPSDKHWGMRQTLLAAIAAGYKIKD